MNAKTLIIVPGLSSPFGDAKYQLAYGLLTDEATIRGYEEVTILALPGQKRLDGTTHGEMSLPSAVECLTKCLSVQEKRGIPYRLLGLSFGGTVCLATETESGLNHCEKLVLWGPIPLWVAWRAFVRGIYRKGLGTETKLAPDADFYRTCAPVEHFLHPRDTTSSSPCQAIRLAAGANDPVCPPFYLDYLKSLCASVKRSHMEVQIVPDCEHNVTRQDKNWQGYLNTVLD